MKFSSVITLSTSRTADSASAGIDRFVGLEHIEPENLHIRSWGLVADAYHAFKDAEGFAKVASLTDFRANDGNLSIPLYVRGRAMSDEKSEYAAEGLKATVKAWDMSSRNLQQTICYLLQALK
jgi:hypothetical protein